MKETVVWTEKINLPENGDNWLEKPKFGVILGTSYCEIEFTDECVYDLCFSPDGEQIIAACGSRILVINVEEGSIVQALKGHKSSVFCVAYSSDGKRFATGGADKNVIIWTNTLQGTLKYVHGESIQCLAFNPQSQLLASCSVNDFGFWTPDKKSVDKHKVPARINACSWSSDGMHLALGLANGFVSIRTKAGSEQIRIERPGGINSAVWGLAFGRNPEDSESEMVIVADWGQILSFYNLKGKQIMKERSLGFDPLKVIYAKTSRDSEYIIVVGQNKSATLFTTEGIRVCSIAEQETWVWTAAIKPNTFSIAVGSQGGVLTYYEVQLLVVHALYKSLYAYRMNMTDVTVQNLLKDTRVRIKCRDVIKKLAIFKDSLAIQFQDRVLIYQKDPGSDDLKYTLKDKINQSFECSLLVICSENLILCQERKLQCYTFNGTKVREWVLDSTIRYIRSVGGMSGKEVLVAGLKNGQVVKIFLDNPFPCPVVSVRSGVRCVDLNLLHSKIGVVDDNSTLFVFDLMTKPPELSFEEPNAISVFWNNYIEDLLSFSGNSGVLNIKANGFPVHRQKMDGVVVGFCGAKIFSMLNSSVTTVEIPLSAPMYQYLQSKMYKEAYKIASLGVPTKDWDALANASLEGLDLEIAKKAFAKTKDIKFLRLLDSFEKQNEGRIDQKSKLIFLADVYAHQGKFHEAAKIYKEQGEEHRAMEMYADLRMFEQASEYMGQSDSADKSKLLRMKAEWALKVNEPRAAAEMFLAAGDKLRAIEIMGQNGWKDMLFDVSRKLDRTDGDSLNTCARNLERLGEVSAAAEMYRRVGKLDKVIELYVIGKLWQEAFIIAEKHPEFKKLAYLPYAQWLAENDQFADSQKAFHEAGCPEEAFRVLDQLRENAVLETRFHDAGYFHWVLSMQYLDLARNSENETIRIKHLDMFALHQKKADLLYAYNPIFRYLESPFTPFMTDALFNISRFVLQEIYDKREQISKMKVAYTLAKQAKKLKAFKVVRFALEALKSLKIPEDLSDGLDLFILESNADPYNDAEEILPHCFRCSTTNPFNPRGNFCINCQHPFVFSFINFDILPLVEFQLGDGISDEEALGMLGSKLPSEGEVKASKISKLNGDRGDGYWKDTDNEEVQILQFDDDGDQEEDSSNDPFSTKTLTMKEGQVGFAPIILDRAQLRALEPTEIIVCKWPQPLRYRFYRNLLPDTSISQCHACFKLFYNDDFMLQVLQKNHCPYCRSPPKSSLLQSNMRNNLDFIEE